MAAAWSWICVDWFCGQFPFLHSVFQLPGSPWVVLQSAWIDFLQGAHCAQWDHFLYFGPMDKSQCCSAVCAAFEVAVEFLYCSVYGVKSAPLVSLAWVLLILPPWKVISSYSLWNLSIYIPSSGVQGKCLVFSHFKDKHVGTHFMSAISLLNTFLGFCFDYGKNWRFSMTQSLQLELGCHAFFCDLVMQHPMMNIWDHKNWLTWAFCPFHGQFYISIISLGLSFSIWQLEKSIFPEGHVLISNYDH